MKLKLGALKHSYTMKAGICVSKKNSQKWKWWDEKEWKTHQDGSCVEWAFIQMFWNSRTSCTSTHCNTLSAIGGWYCDISVILVPCCHSYKCLGKMSYYFCVCGYQGHGQLKKELIVAHIRKWTIRSEAQSPRWPWKYESMGIPRSLHESPLMPRSRDVYLLSDISDFFSSLLLYY